jgi:hypothetical protein
VQQRIIEVEEWSDADEPICITFLRSGFDGMVIMVTEDPYDDPGLELITQEEKDKKVHEWERRKASG